MALHAMTRTIVTWVTSFLKKTASCFFCQVTTRGTHYAWIATPGTVESGTICDSHIWLDWRNRNKQWHFPQLFFRDCSWYHWILKDFYCIMDYVVSFDRFHIIRIAWWSRSQNFFRTCVLMSPWCSRSQG